MRRTNFIYIMLGIILCGVSLYFQPSNIKAIYYHCPLARENGNPEFFSQQSEDYILSLVFSDVRHGTYIDVGAYHPTKDSVTAYFYNQGWHGINIEPSYSNYQLFIDARPRDINLNIGAGDKIENLTFYKIPKTGLSTFDPAVAEQAKKDGFVLTQEHLTVTTLNHILDQHPLGKINFIKIDVEGFERKVLLGLNLEKYRPQLFIIEATEPRTQIPSHQKWEAILLSHHYQFAYFDGLNRYYIASESAHLLNKFSLVKVCMQ